MTVFHVRPKIPSTVTSQPYMPPSCLLAHSLLLIMRDRGLILCMAGWVQVFYDFGLEETVKKLSANPDWCALRGTGRDTSAFGLYGSPEAARLDVFTGGKFSEPTSNAYEIGLWISCYDSKGRRALSRACIVRIRAHWAQWLFD